MMDLEVAVMADPYQLLGVITEMMTGQCRVSFVAERAYTAGIFDIRHKVTLH